MNRVVLLVAKWLDSRRFCVGVVDGWPGQLDVRVYSTASKANAEAGRLASSP